MHQDYMLRRQNKFIIHGIVKEADRCRKKCRPMCLLQHVNGATITDNYWIRPIDSELKYSDVRFTDDYFASLALTGSRDILHCKICSGKE